MEIMNPHLRKGFIKLSRTVTDHAWLWYLVIIFFKSLLTHTELIIYSVKRETAHG